MQRFRHSCWVSNDKIYVHGGFESSMPNIPLREICTIDIQKLLTGKDALFEKIKSSKSGKEAEKSKTKKTDYDKRFVTAQDDFVISRYAHIATSAPQNGDHAAQDFSLVVR